MTTKKRLLISNEEREFYLGILISLQILHLHDASDYALDIVKSIDFKKLCKVAKENDGVDMDTIRWLKRNM